AWPRCRWRITAARCRPSPACCRCCGSIAFPCAASRSPPRGCIAASPGRCCRISWRSARSSSAPSRMQYVAGNRLTLLKNGAQYFPALVEAIDAARSEVFLESYLYADDETGERVTDALARAAARGVNVHLLVDGFGARDFSRRFRERLRASGAHLLVFRPEFGRRRWQRGRLRRMHRKLAAIDGNVAFVGGINEIGRASCRERAARAEGAVARQ